MPEYRKVPLAEIDEPETPARVSMDDVKLAELRDSMAQNGLLSPVGLKKKNGRLEVEFGHRRLLCAIGLGWHEIPALVFESWEIAEGAAMLAENVDREDLNAGEEALLFAEHQTKYNLDEAGLVARFKRSADYIADRLRLLRGEKCVLDAVLARRINFSVAREINKCKNESDRIYLLDVAIRTGYSAHVIADQRRLLEAYPAPTPMPAAASAEPVPAPAVHCEAPKCHFCGGDKDPFNLVIIYVHKWELQIIEKALADAANG